MIEVIDYHKDCEDMKKLFLQVLSRIPPDDLAKIESVCEQAEFCTDPNMPDDPVPFHAAFHHYDKSILVAVDSMIELSAAKQRGIFAHELGHARDGFDSPPTGSNKGLREARANSYAVAWGFLDDLSEFHGKKPTKYEPDK